MSVLNLILAPGSCILDIQSSTGMLDICERFRKSQEFFFQYLPIWLHQVLVVAHGITDVHCSMWDLLIAAHGI